MLTRLFVFLSAVLLVVSATSWESTADNDETNPSGRFARDLNDLNQRLKFAFAFAKRSALNDKYEKNGFAFAKRSSSSDQEGARFARSAFAKFAEMNNLV